MLKWNDCIGEGILDMTKFYKKVFKKNVAINFFEKRKGGAADRKKKRNKLESVIPDSKKDIPDEEYYSGVITKDVGNGCYDIAYDDGNKGQRVPDHLIRSLMTIEREPFKIQDKVLRTSNLVLPGTIIKDHGNSTFDVEYDDKTKEFRIKGELLKPLVEKKVILREGDKVEAR